MPPEINGGDAGLGLKSLKQQGRAGTFPMQSAARGASPHDERRRDEHHELRRTDTEDNGTSDAECEDPESMTTSHHESQVPRVPVLEDPRYPDLSLKLKSSRKRSSGRSKESQTRAENPHFLSEVAAAVKAIRPQSDHGGRKVVSSHEVVDRSRELDKKDRAYKKLDKDFRDLDAAHKTLLAQFHQKEADLAALQEQTLNESLYRDSMDAEDDDSIRDRLLLQTNDRRHWANDYAIPNLYPQHLRVEDQKVTSRMAAEFGIPTFLSQLRFRNAPENLPPRLLLNAELNAFLGEHIICKAFLTIEDPSKTPNQASVDHFSAAYELARTHDAVNAHRWRSQTLQMLRNAETAFAAARPGSVSGPLARRRAYYRMLMSMFEQGDASVLLRRCNPAEAAVRHQRLYDIFEAAGETFSRLWCQKVFISTWKFSQLGKVHSKANASAMTPHQAQKLEDDDDSSLNGRPVELVVQPAIVAYGNERGGNYHQHKIWAKAVVWLGPIPSNTPGQ